MTLRNCSFEYSLESSSILPHITLNTTNLSDDVARPCDRYFGMGFSKLGQHDVWYLLPAATKSLMVKLKMIYGI